MLFAAHLTTSSALSFLNFHLLKNPDILQNVKDEQKQLQRKFGSNITHQTLQNMSYSDKVIREVLRVSPIAPVIPRTAMKDFELKGYRIPKGWKVQLCAGRTIVENWKDSWQKFDPSRWEGVEAGNVREYIPFGAGPHTCLGMQMALAELKVYLAVIGRDYDIELIQQDQEAPLESFQVFQDGLFIQFTKSC
eukprot:TRINITY_DN4852_c1_g1_i3.p3 TRINITY_DN4852_c1_g1~~TRINITY_DN4852_c1_g1_i3.p3  ORF type:complete len:206 (-),score=16.80 TRINITY_DN4852_c1_g1_i3:339-914(-)